MVNLLTQESSLTCFLSCQPRVRVDEEEIIVKDQDVTSQTYKTASTGVPRDDSDRSGMHDSDDTSPAHSWNLERLPYQPNTSLERTRLLRQESSNISQRTNCSEGHLSRTISIDGDAGSDIDTRSTLSGISYSIYRKPGHNSLERQKRSFIGQYIEDRAFAAATERCIRTYDVNTQVLPGEEESELDRVKRIASDEIKEKMDDYMGSRLPVSTLSKVAYCGLLSIGLLIGGVTPFGLVPFLIVGGLGMLSNAWYMHRKMKYSMDGVMRVSVCKARGEIFVNRAPDPKPKGIKAPYKIIRSYYRPFCTRQAQKSYDKVIAKIAREYPNLTKEQKDAVLHEANIYREGKGIEYWQKRLPTKIALTIALGVAEFSIMAAFGATLVNPITIAIAASVVTTFLAIKIALMVYRLKFSMLSASYAKISSFSGQEGSDGKPITPKRSWWDKTYESHVHAKMDRVVNYYTKRYDLSSAERTQLKTKLYKTGIRKSREIFKYRCKTEAISPAASGIYKLLMVATRGNTPIEAAARATSSALGFLFLGVNLYIRVHLAIVGTAQEEARNVLAKRAKSEAAADLAAAEAAAAEILEAAEAATQNS